jgi:hypothetical protein
MLWVVMVVVVMCTDVAAHTHQAGSEVLEDGMWLCKAWHGDRQ